MYTRSTRALNAEPRGFSCSRCGLHPVLASIFQRALDAPLPKPQKRSEETPSSTATLVHVATARMTPSTQPGLCRLSLFIGAFTLTCCFFLSPSLSLSRSLVLSAPGPSFSFYFPRFFSFTLIRFSSCFTATYATGTSHCTTNNIDDSDDSVIAVESTLISVRIISQFIPASRWSRLQCLTNSGTAVSACRMPVSNDIKKLEQQT